jgi:exodeoxyribonuclease-5
MSFEWTECQQNAINDVVAWSYCPDEYFWGIVGSAGTGKSTVVREILQHIKQKYGVCVSAPTHKAKNVLASITGENCYTVQKLLGLRPNMDLEDFDIHNVKFQRGAEDHIRKHSFIVVDEASMIPYNLFEYMKDRATQCRTKILFVGDKLQLPPVGEEESCALERKHLDGLNELITPVRTELKNPISLLNLALRCDIDFSQKSYSLLREHLNNFPEFEELGDLDVLMAQNHNSLFKWIRSVMPRLKNDSGSYEFVDNLNNLKEKCINAFLEEEFITNKNHAKFIAYNNAVVSGVGEQIRNTLFDTKEQILLGDLFTGYSTITTYPDMRCKIINGEDYIITAKSDKTLSEGNVPGWYVTLEAITSTRKEELFFVSPDDYDEFAKKIEPYYSAAKADSKKWKKYYDFKNDHILIHDLNKRTGNFRLPSKDLGYIFSTTVHKSQGSTYNKVFVDGKNIGSAYGQGLKKSISTTTSKDYLRKFCLRLIYVAISRAKQSATIYI